MNYPKKVWWTRFVMGRNYIVPLRFRPFQFIVLRTQSSEWREQFLFLCPINAWLHKGTIRWNIGIIHPRWSSRSLLFVPTYLPRKGNILRDFWPVYEAPLSSFRPVTGHRFRSCFDQRRSPYGNRRTTLEWLNNM